MCILVEAHVHAASPTALSKLSRGATCEVQSVACGPAESCLCAADAPHEGKMRRETSPSASTLEIEEPCTPLSDDALLDDDDGRGNSTSQEHCNYPSDVPVIFSDSACARTSVQDKALRRELQELFEKVSLPDSLLPLPDLAGASPASLTRLKKLTGSYVHYVHIIRQLRGIESEVRPPTIVG